MWKFDNIDPNNGLQVSKLLKTVPIYTISDYKRYERHISHFQWIESIIGPMWTQFRIKIQGKPAILTILIQILHLKCPNSWKCFQSIVSPIINVIKAILSYFRYPKSLMSPIWAEFSADIQVIQTKLTILTQMMHLKCPNFWKWFQFIVFKFKAISSHFRLHGLSIQGRNW